MLHPATGTESRFRLVSCSIAGEELLVSVLQTPRELPRDGHRRKCLPQSVGQEDQIGRRSGCEVALLEPRKRRRAFPERRSLSFEKTILSVIHCRIPTHFAVV